MNRPIGTIATMIGNRPRSTWINVNGQQRYRCVSSENEDIWRPGVETNWSTENKHLWIVEHPKERLFDKLYLKLKRK